jgi:Coenzyme PQQ synthesis protein D (PqqD)
LYPAKYTFDINDGEMLIMSALDSTLYSLDDVATSIKAVDGITALHEVIEQKLSLEYNVAPEIAARDVVSFVEELAERGILVLGSAN